MLTALAMVALCQAPQPRLFLQPNLKRQGAGSSDRAFSPWTEYLFANPGALPSATVPTTNLVAICMVNAGGTAWTCTDKNGTSLGTVTQGTGTTYQWTPFGYYSLSDVTSAKAPSLVAASLDSIWKADHTVILAGYGTALTNASFQHWFGFNDGSNYLFVRNDSGNFKCEWNGGGGFKSPAVSNYSPVDGWSVVSCRRSGNDHYARVNGVDSAAANGSTITGNIGAGTSYYFGDRWPGAGLPLRGPEAWAFIYNDDLTTTQLAAAESGFWGVDSRVAASLASETYCLDADGGQVFCYYKGGAMVGPLGMRTVRGNTATNKWAADSLLATGGTDVGTPTITAAAGAGPFYDVESSNTCAMVVDDAAGAFEGKKGADGYVGNGYYTASFYMGAGDAGTVVDKARIQVDVTGGGWIDAGTTHTCDVSGMTYAIARQNCQTPLFYADAGSPTVRASYLVGNAASDTGSIQVCQRQLTAAGWPTVPITTNVARGNSAQSMNPVTDGWPDAGLGGKYEIVFAPVYSAASDSWDEQTDTIYLFDAHDGTPEHGVVTLFGYNIAGRAMARTELGGASTEFLLDGVSLTPGSLYAVSMEWRPDGVGTCAVKWRWNSCSGTVAACSATTLRGSTAGGVCPAQPTAVNLANRYDSTVPTDVNIAAVRIFGP